MASESNNQNYIKLYSSRAHVFQIDPITKNSWLPKGESAIPISIIATNGPDDDQTTVNKELKIVGHNEEGETVLDSVILLKTQFTKRSQKFGQWTGPTGMVYGLGFSTEIDLNEFVETFQQLQRNVLSSTTPIVSSQLQQDTASIDDKSNYWNRSQEHMNNGSEINGREFRSLSKVDEENSRAQYNKNFSPHSSYQQMTRRQQGGNEPENILTNNSMSDNDVNPRYPRNMNMVGVQSKPNNGSHAGRISPETEGSTLSQGEWQLKDQLKQATYENERLKQALEESSKNASVWHNELLNLRTNNVKLTLALQESKSHVEDWERELLHLRTDNKELKLRVLALESVDDPERSNDDYKTDLQRYKDYVDEIQGQLRKRENEVDQLQKSMEQLELKAQISSSRNGQLDDAASKHDGDIIKHQNLKLDVISAKFEAKISELANVQKEFAQLVNTPYQ